MFYSSVFFPQGKGRGKGDVTEVHVSFLDKKRSRAWLSPAAVQPWSAAPHFRAAGPTSSRDANPTSGRAANPTSGRPKQLAAAEAEAASLYQARLTS